jgi:RNA polymerase sigma-70 factor (ECF subfamily)
MIDLAARDTWQEVDKRLRPFVARRVACDADVDDVMQDVFLRMRRGLDDLREEDRFVSWLFTVARSALLDQRRRVHRQVLTDAPPVDETPIDDDDEELEAMMARCVTPLVANLPVPYREAITLIELEGLSIQDAANMTGVSLTCMKSRVQRGRVALRKVFEDCCELALDARGHVIDCTPRSCSC